MTSPAPTNIFLEAGDGMAHPYKWFYAKKYIIFSYDLG
jgi:hypothetical protein